MLASAAWQAQGRAWKAVDIAAATARGPRRVPRSAPSISDAFAAHLTRAWRRDHANAAGTLAALAIEDLYLACACLAQAPGAAAAFAARHGATIRGAIARIVRGADAAEVEQQFIDALLVGSATSPAKLDSYAGRAPLDRWVGVAAQRAALDVAAQQPGGDTRARRARPRSRPPARLGLETGYLKERYRSAFEDALKHALARLPERERVLLRLHLVNGVSVDKIGKMFDVSQATASRWLAAARETVLDDIKATLASSWARRPTSSLRLPGWSPAGWT